MCASSLNHAPSQASGTTSFGVRDSMRQAESGDEWVHIGDVKWGGEREGAEGRGVLGLGLGLEGRGRVRVLVVVVNNLRKRGGDITRMKDMKFQALMYTIEHPAIDHWSTDAKGRRIPSISNADRQNLQEHSDALEEQMQKFEVQSQSGVVDESHLEAEMREMLARMDMLTRKMVRVLVPAYDSENSSEFGD
ncbi:hypothetical protein D9758_013081 [Tetrapyrgos nigripes]|uniref:Uncharacterized protein n=1 Tax=Tetrapyrgos nigripes TaxID=182062 RepID=A0A8H5CS83_9AGAR|nr:hypothetical protein D9758_013081 [Tetrapyrgos nigripes]